jgi:hypothetical protein
LAATRYGVMMLRFAEQIYRKAQPRRRGALGAAGWGSNPRAAFGEALDPDKLERLGRYEVHLDRKLERMLTMLLGLSCDWRSVRLQISW